MSNFVRKSVSVGSNNIDIHIVDDDESICSIYLKLAQSFSYRARAFSSPAEYLEYMGCDGYSRPTLTILADMDMPKMSGLELMSAVRKVYPDQKFIINTGGVLPVKSEKGFACFYFLKPISVSKLKKVYKALALCMKSGPSEACKVCLSIYDDRALFVKNWRCPSTAF